MTAHQFRVYGCTDTGLVREVNEDHILMGRFIKNSGAIGLEFADDDDFMSAYGLIFAVADGIGGAAAGEVASKLALTTIERHFYGFEKQADNTEVFQEALLAASKRANDTVMQVAGSRPECRGMGCTLTGVCLTPSGYLVFNSGDSRVYRFRSGYLKQLTEDDTLVNIAIKAGQMSYEEAENSDKRHTITNSIGYTDFRLNINSGPDLRVDDRLLICSDGLHDLVAIERIEEIISQSPIDQAVTRLVDEAKTNGGHDNISIVLIKYDEILEFAEIEIILPDAEIISEPAVDEEKCVNTEEAEPIPCEVAGDDRPI